MPPKNIATINFELSPQNNHRLATLCGQVNTNLHQLESHFGVEINNRSYYFEVIGPEKMTRKATEAIQQLYDETLHQTDLTSHQIHLMLQSIKTNSTGKKEIKKLGEYAIKTPKLTIKPRSPNQLHYVEDMHKFDINFGIGPAGTGKTYLAVAYAVHALYQEKINRIIIVRPAVEAGEHLGFLPGDIAEKVNPYLRPIYDALYDMLGFSAVNKLIDKNVIEVAPLAFMRGRTLNDAIIILDESQNTTIEQMKMFLTRLGFDSKAIITGDVTQIDLPKGKLSGLKHAVEVLKNENEIGFTFFQAHDVVRHSLVQNIIRAYENYDEKYPA